ncbi:MAG: hypothetical protein RIE08_15950 [Acidimicrobiales bacterium]
MRPDLDAVGRALAAAWADETASVVVPELSLADGFAIQAAVIGALDSPVVGYRIVASSERARGRLGIDGPVVGVVVEKALTAPDATPAVAPRIVEAEFAVTVDFRIDEPSTPALIRTWHLSLDLPRSRITDDWGTLSAGQLVADACLLGDVMVGPPVDVDTTDSDGVLVVTGRDTQEEHPMPAPHPDTAAEYLALVKDAIMAGTLPPPATATPFVQLGTETPIRLGDTATAARLTHPVLGHLDLPISIATNLTGDHA